jgi:signal transduction histidine kinase/ligand-binding sensor domain-containing protein/CheY-like chemotaxis protein/AraC-like DNA-binding protein
MKYIADLPVMKKFCLPVFFLLVTMLGYGQAPVKNKVLKYALKDGLSFGIVNSITQDADGFMWFATSDGLNRFDGSTFKVFKTNAGDSAGLSGNFVQKIFSDYAGNLWVSSRDGLSKLDTKTEKFTHYNLRNHNVVKNDVDNITQAGGGNLWIASYGSGFSYFKTGSGDFISYDRNNLPQLTSDRIVSILEDSKGLLWLGTQDGGINVFHQKNGKVIGKAFISLVFGNKPIGRVNEIFEDHLHNIWIATSNGLLYYDRKSDNVTQFQTRQKDIKSNTYIALNEDSENNLLIGLQDGGLYKLPLKTFTGIAADFKLTPVVGDDGYNMTQRSVQNIYLDRHQNVWVGTYGEGVYMVSSISEKFTRIQKIHEDASGKSLVRFYGMCQDNAGLLWFGTDGDGIYKTRPDGSIVKRYYADGRPGSLTDNAILTGYRDREGNLWFGTYAKGLFRYNAKTDSFINYIHKSNDARSLGANDVRVIYQDRQKNLWVGSNGGGLSLFDAATDTFTNYTPANSTLSSYDVRAITEDEKGDLLVGTYGGSLDRLDVKKKKFSSYFTVAQEKHFLPGQVIFALCLSGDKLWVGTEGDGLLVYDIRKRTFQYFNEKNRLANNTVYAIQQAEDQSVWVSTNKGLSNIDLDKNTVKNFDQSNGLQAGQFNVGSVIYDKQNGAMYFGGTEGLNIFNTEAVNNSYFKPKVVLTGLQIFGNQQDEHDKQGSGIALSKAINENGQLVLQPDQSVFSIQYTSLNYAYPQKGEFAYMLEGLDKTWNFVGNQHSAIYRYLPPGNYTFKVKCSNQDGVWFNNYATLQIKILPPWYKTWWAYLSYALAIGLIIYYYLQYRANQAHLKYEIKLAQLSAEKDKELNERKLSFFTNISHEFRTPLTLIINPIKELLYHEREVDTSSLNIVYRNAKRLLSLVDQLLLFRKADSDAGTLTIYRLNIVELCKEVFLCFTHQAKAKGLNFEFICADQDIELFADREKIEIALFNLLSNAMKFTPAGGSVTVVLMQEEGRVNIEVIDTGYGINKETEDKLYSKFYQQESGKGPSVGGFGIGLFLVKKFIEGHSGTIRHENNTGGGTKFTISLLKGSDHLNHQVIYQDSETTSVLLQELVETEMVESAVEEVNLLAEDPDAGAEMKSILVIDDNDDIREYLKLLFKNDYKVHSAVNGREGLSIIKDVLPDIVISDVMMEQMTGIELCTAIREDMSISHIPVILLTSSASPEIKLKGIEGGADDYISKPFDKELLKARVAGILRNKNNLQKYFYNEITLNATNQKIPAEYKIFLDNCIKVVEKHLMDPDFNIQTLAGELGISHSSLYKKIKFISGQSANGFIRFIRLRKAAEILINSRHNIFETSFLVGINDIKYFREQFKKVFGINPSQYMKKYRKNLAEDLVTNEFVGRTGN